MKWTHNLAYYSCTIYSIFSEVTIHSKHNEAYQLWSFYYCVVQCLKYSTVAKSQEFIYVHCLFFYDSRFFYLCILTEQKLISECKYMVFESSTFVSVLFIEVCLAIPTSPIFIYYNNKNHLLVNEKREM